jgi:hypothetical protein
MISDIRIRAGTLTFSENSGTNKFEYPIALTGECFYRRKDGSIDYLRTYKIDEVWKLSIARKVLQELLQAMEAVQPSITDLNWDY